MPASWEDSSKRSLTASRAHHLTFIHPLQIDIRVLKIITTSCNYPPILVRARHARSCKREKFSAVMDGHPLFSWMGCSRAGVKRSLKRFGTYKLNKLKLNCPKLLIAPPHCYHFSVTAITILSYKNFSLIRTSPENLASPSLQEIRCCV